MCGTHFGRLLLPKHRCSAAAAALQQLDVSGSAVGAHGAERADVGLGRGAADVGREQEVDVLQHRRVESVAELHEPRHRGAV